MNIIEQIKDAIANPVGGTSVIAASDLQDIVTRLKAAERDA